MNLIVFRILFCFVLDLFKFQDPQRIHSLYREKKNSAGVCELKIQKKNLVLSRRKRQRNGCKKWKGLDFEGFSRNHGNFEILFIVLDIFFGFRKKRKKLKKKSRFK